MRLSRTGSEGVSASTENRDFGIFNDPCSSTGHVLLRSQCLLASSTPPIHIHTRCMQVGKRLPAFNGTMRRLSVQSSLHWHSQIQSNGFIFASLHTGKPLITLPDQILQSILFHENRWYLTPSPLSSPTIRPISLLPGPINERQQSHATLFVTPLPFQ
jgi:hypothetical protein